MKSTTEDVANEAYKAMEPEKVENSILAVQNLQSWKFLERHDIGGSLRNNKSIVAVDKDTLGVFSVKGVSFTIDKRERMVILSANNSGASYLI